MYMPLFGRRLRRITAELIASAVIVSFLEEFALIYFGLLSITGLPDFLAISVILSVIELVLMFMIEEFLIAAKHEVRRRMNRQSSLSRHLK